MALGDGGQPGRRRNLKVVLGYKRSVTCRLPGFWGPPPEAHEGKRRFTKVSFSQENLH